MLGARVVVVDVMENKLAHARQLGADATVNAFQSDVAAKIRDITSGGAQVSIEALGHEIKTNASVERFATLGRHVYVSIPLGDGMMQ